LVFPCRYVDKTCDGDWLQIIGDWDHFVLEDPIRVIRKCSTSGDGVLRIDAVVVLVYDTGLRDQQPVAPREEYMEL